MENLSPQRLVVYAASESVVPGASNLLEGNYARGIAHVVAGSVAGSVYGPAGVLLVAANSLFKTVTGEHLYERLGILRPPEPATPAARGASSRRDDDDDESGEPAETERSRPRGRSR